MHLDLHHEEGCECNWLPRFELQYHPTLINIDIDKLHSTTGIHIHVHTIYTYVNVCLLAIQLHRSFNQSQLICAHTIVTFVASHLMSR